MCTPLGGSKLLGIAHGGCTAGVMSLAMTATQSRGRLANLPKRTRNQIGSGYHWLGVSQITNRKGEYHVCPV
jgi:hypothetical protein